MRYFYLVVLLCGTALLGGCATNEYENYREESRYGYFYRMELTPNLVRFRLFAYSRFKGFRVQQQLLFHVAEYARSNRKPWFMLYHDPVAAANAKPVRQIPLGALGPSWSGQIYVQLLDQAAPEAYETEAVLKERDAFVAAQAAVPQTD